jgi:hypothetical protein
MPVQEQEQVEAKVPSAQGPMGVDQVKRRARLRQMETEQSLLVGAVGGLVTAAIGAGLWATITVLTQYQIGWMAVGIGFLVGHAVRLTGKGVHPSFGIMAACLGCLGCLAGNLLSTCIFVSLQESTPLGEVLAQLNPPLVMELMAATFSMVDLLFYGLAIYFAYRYSFYQNPDKG